MSSLWLRGSVALAFTMCLATSLLAAGSDDDQSQGFLPFSLSPDGSFVPKRVRPKPQGAPGVTTPLVPATPKPAPAPPRTEAQQLDDLFGQLAAASSEDEAKGLAARIQRVWIVSGSPTVDLLAARADGAAEKGSLPVARDLLDKVVTLEPQWAEGWNKRATLRFLQGDDDGAMSDIGQVLVREPRHFGALSGMATILQRHGFKKDALALLRRTATIYPHNEDLGKLIDSLTLEVEGRPI